MQGLGSYPLVLAQSDLCATVLPAIARGEHVGAFAITETEAGSDIAGMRTTARQDGDTIRIDGEKTFISNAPLATAYVLFAREGERDDGRPAHSAFFVPADSPGIRVTPIRVIAPHPIGMVTFEGVRIPASHRIGAPGRGLDLALRNLDQFRVTVGAAALGIADRAFEVMVEHLATRVQFGKPLAEQQGLRFALAELATEHMAAQLLVYRAAGARDRGATTPERPAMAKLAATETAQRVVDRAVQSLGGLGVTVGQVPERLYREVRALRIYEGTSEIQKLVIARALFGR
jgi:acyl-CoA dehydrogenase